MMKNKFYTKKLKSRTPVLRDYPFFLLIETGWDDFSFKTDYILYHYKSSRQKLLIGNTKILEKGVLQTELPVTFTKIPGKYCSLGQDNKFYETLEANFSLSEIEQILDAINDITYCKGLASEFENEKGFKESLTRYSEAQKALNEAELIVKGISAKNSFQFTFKTEVRGFQRPHVIPLDFQEDSFLPKRLVAFIGKNGSGKSQVLAKLAFSLSGLSQNQSDVLSTKYLPPFSRVIAVSYTLFDKLNHPRATKLFSYYYCGIQTQGRLLTQKQIDHKIISALKGISEKRELNIFGAYITELLGADVALKLLSEDYTEILKDVKVYDKNGYSIFSSGQILIILVFAEILATIRPHSLILFDEPETHLHPNAISNFMSIVYKILKRYNSFCVMATHSPQIIQEIPSSSIFLFSKESETVRKLATETFGENLTTLTEKIFQTIDLDENYKKILMELSKTMTSSKIQKLFNDDGNSLSLNAKIYVEGLFSKQK